MGCSLHVVKPGNQSTTLSRIDRTPVYKGMARLIWMQYALENDIDIALTPFERAPKDVQLEILQTCEALANMALSPDLRDTGIMVIADAICRGNYPHDQTISEVPRQAAMSYMTTAQVVLRSFLLNMLTNPPDQYYRDSMCRMLDSLAPKKGVN